VALANSHGIGILTIDQVASFDESANSNGSGSPPALGERPDPPVRRFFHLLQLPMRVTGKMLDTEPRATPDLDQDFRLIIKLNR
jgi:hypothetical protein